MNSLTLTFGITLIAVLAFNFWLDTPKGKKWLRDL